MKHQTAAKTRKEMKHKMATVFCEKIQKLPPDLQNILLDDLVTAFENRLSVLDRAQTNEKCFSIITEDVEYETI
jgi:hypothetical protein